MAEVIDRILSDEKISFKDALRLLRRYLDKLPYHEKTEVLIDLRAAFSKE